MIPDKSQYAITTSDDPLLEIDVLQALIPNMIVVDLRHYQFYEPSDVCPPTRLRYVWALSTATRCLHILALSFIR